MGAAEISHQQLSYQEFLDRIGKEEFCRPYRIACENIRQELEAINEEYSKRLGRTLISQITYRIKTPESCLNKLLKKNQAVEWRNAGEHLGDIAGVRVVCSFLDDVYRLAEVIVKKEDLEVIRIKDYVRRPKASGYQSLHIIVLAPAGGEEKRKAEIQIRTQAMNFWAAVEHHFIYKNEAERFQKNHEKNRFSKDLKACARTIYKIDQRMLIIRKKMEKAQYKGKKIS